MEQHPIPRQVTTFEFKLIGFMTLKQFLYLLAFVPTGLVVMRVFPIPLLNLIIGVLIVGFGAALAFLPINERPLDVYVRNLYRRLTSPTQYTYKKSNEPLYFLNDLFFMNDPHRVLTHIESQEKLSQYLNTSGAKTAVSAGQKRVTSLLASQSQMKGLPRGTVPVQTHSVNRSISSPPRISAGTQLNRAQQVAARPPVQQRVQVQPSVKPIQNSAVSGQRPMPSTGAPAQSQARNQVPDGHMTIRPVMRQEVASQQIVPSPVQRQPIPQSVLYAQQPAQHIQQPVQQSQQYVQQVQQTPQHSQQPLHAPSDIRYPFLTGVIKNNRKIPLPGVLVYIKNGQGQALRLLKTNPYGVFATYHPLIPGEYFFEVKDPKGGYFFDTIKVQVADKNPTPIELYSKELL